MDILVDYANIPESERHRGTAYVIDKIFTTIGLAHLKGKVRICFRLYGGWYERRMPTRLSQRIAAEILAAFPAVWQLTEAGESAQFLINVELAYGIRFDPPTHFLHTFRSRSVPRGIGCRLPSAAGCAAADCPLIATHRFFLEQECPAPGCRVSPEDMLFRGEQKLVDTMLATDLFYNAHSGADRVAIVSSDDDMWPAVKAALHLGSSVIHVHTQPGRSTPHFYARTVHGNYFQLNI